MKQRDTVRSALVELALRSDQPLWLTDEQVGQWLIARCHNQEQEIELIVAAIRCEIVSEMKRLYHGLAPIFLLPKLTRWFIQQSGVENREALWAVESWAMALGLITFVEADLPSRTTNKN